jgi:hypothetical protein
VLFARAAKQRQPFLIRLVLGELGQRAPEGMIDEAVARADPGLVDLAEKGGRSMERPPDDHLSAIIIRALELLCRAAFTFYWIFDACYDSV